MTAWDIVIACGIPTAFTGFFVWLLERNIAKREKKREEQDLKREKERERQEAKRESEQKEQDKAREQFELMLVRGNIASITLGEATAKAVQRIPDAHCNGDMKDALKYAEQLKHEQRDFLAEQGIHHIN